MLHQTENSHITLTGSTSRMDEKNEKKRDETHLVALSLPNWIPYAQRKKMETQKQTATRIQAMIRHHQGSVILFFLSIT